MVKTINTTQTGIAMHGYDPVAYFVENQPTKGYPRFSHHWQDATWHFVSAVNRDSFASDPTRYAPAFGGYCALGRAMGVNVNGSPKRWRIEDGRLYLNKNLIAQGMHNLFKNRIRKLANNQ